MKRSSISHLGRAAAIIALGLVAVSSARAQTADPDPCAAPERHQLDFWIGEWDVTDVTSGEHAGHSLIESRHGGCVIRENWTSPGFSGESLNAWSARDRRWHQSWMDQGGAYRPFAGGLEGAAMVLVADLERPNGEPVKVRIRLSPRPDGTVSQYSDYSIDGGATWKLSYDYLYRRIAGHAD